MPVQDKDRACDVLVQKMTAGDSLSADEKSHLAGCENCMSQVIQTLDETAMSESQGVGMSANGANGDLSHTRPEAKKALERGRLVFEREFGISLTAK